MTLRAALVMLAGLSFLCACGPTTAGTPDAAAPDGGPRDASSVASADAATAPDAAALPGADSGSLADAASGADAGSAPDSGPAADAGSAVDAGGVDPVALLASFESVFCDVRVRCELNQDKATCLQSFAERTGTTFGTAAALVDSVAAGRVAFEASQVPGCLAAIGALNCSDSATGGDVVGIPACRAAFPAGGVAAGGACIHSAACVSGTYCRLATVGGCAGVCTAEPAECTLELGDPSDALCGFARGCEKSGASYRCVDFRAAGTAGQPCGSRKLCGVGLECASGLCQPLPSVGSSCSILVGCHDPEAEACVFQGSSGAYCMASAAAGGGCQYAIQCGGFESPRVCDPATSLCVDRPAAGAPCVLAAPGNAIGFCDELTAYCDTSLAPPTCIAYAAPGTSCSSSEQCGPFWSNRKCSTVCVTKPSAQRCAP
ncbi:MAG TPA: hypothetical protein VGK67_21790 [Myxococcales bacterium]|jgi:hypothetical protein